MAELNEEDTDIYKAYNVYIKLLSVSEDDPKGDLVETKIQMIDCNLIDNAKFKEGGIFAEEIDAIPDPKLCPERGDISLNGELGSNIFVVTQKTDDYDI